MSIAQRIYNDIESNGTAEERQVLGVVTKLLTENPLRNLDLLNDLFNGLSMLDEEARKETKGKHTIMDFVVMISFLYDEMGQEHPNVKAKRKDNYPPLKLVN